MKTHMGIGMHLKYKMHLTHYVFNTVKTIPYISYQENETHSCPISCPTNFTCNPYGFEDKMEFYD
jgi:hypothetical protein